MSKSIEGMIECPFYLEEGKNVAIVTDRGTPIISDPGYKTVKFLKDNGYNVIGLPGACAFVPALIMSSISSEHFTFYGFLERENKKMRDELLIIKNDSSKIAVIYESPKRIVNTLERVMEELDNPYICLCNDELLKQYL